MRGSALRASGGAGNSRAPRGLAGLPARAPGQEEALPLVGSPAPERFASGTSDRRICSLGTRTRESSQGALLPETPACSAVAAMQRRRTPEVGIIPPPPHPGTRCR